MPRLFDARGTPVADAAMSEPSPVMLVAELDLDELRSLIEDFGLGLEIVAPGAPIPGTYWGEPEAGLVRNRLYVRTDTPVHSALHEAAHFICMDAGRRTSLDTDAGGDFVEECAVCYLQVLLADWLTGTSRERMLADMDAWGYSFRLGSARRWFQHDAHDALEWLEQRGLPDCDPDEWPEAVRYSRWSLRSDYLA